METVLDDDTAPAGVRAKAATDLLDRAGHKAGVEITLTSTVNVVDATALIRERLERLRTGQQPLQPQEIVEAEVLDDNDNDD
jgi:hypothetical protein